MRNDQREVQCIECSEVITGDVDQHDNPICPICQEVQEISKEERR